MSACETCQGSGLRSPVGDGCDVYRTAACPSCLGTGTTYYRPCYYCRRPRGNDHQDGCTCNTCLRDVCWGINEDCVATRAVAIETCQALANIGTGVLIAHLAETAADFAREVRQLACSTTSDHEHAAYWLSAWAGDLCQCGYCDDGSADVDEEQP